MIQKVTTLSIALLALAVSGKQAVSQTTTMPSIMVVEVENQVEYVQDSSDGSTFTLIPEITPPAGRQRNFAVVTILGDIVSVNGQPAKGVYVGRTRAVRLRPSPSPGEAIADVVRTAIREVIFEILTADGRPIGSIVGLGFSGGAPPPGAPVAQRGGSWAIVGGTGAFLGARGQFGGAQTPGSGPFARMASMSEDPGNRRTNGGGTQPFVLTLIPMSVPQITTIFGEPAIFHSRNSSLVTASTPAEAGELLSLHASGLGPTVLRIDPGQPFPAAPPAIVNSPLEVKVNGNAAEVISAVGMTGTVDGYQVQFRVPADVPKGLATIQLSAAWIAGPSVSMMIR